MVVVETSCNDIITVAYDCRYALSGAFKLLDHFWLFL